jgi:hypothetical protein
MENFQSSSFLPSNTDDVPEGMANQLGFIHGGPLPASWNLFEEREILYEKSFDWEQILNRANEFGINMHGVAEFLRDKHIIPYISVSSPGYPALTRLFYSSLSLSSSGNVISGFIGKFSFSFSVDDIVALFETDTAWLSTATDIFDKSIISSIPSCDELVRSILNVTDGASVVEMRGVHVLLFMFIKSNIYPTDDSIIDMPKRITELIWLLENHHPCLAHVIFDVIRSFVGLSYMDLPLPFPSLITRLLVSKNYSVDSFFKVSVPLLVNDHHLWEFIKLSMDEDFSIVSSFSGLTIGGEVIDNKAMNESVCTESNETEPQWVTLKVWKVVNGALQEIEDFIPEDRA